MISAIFLSLAEGRVNHRSMARCYNHRRPHWSLRALTPVEFAQLKTEKNVALAIPLPGLRWPMGILHGFGPDAVAFV